MRCSRNAFNWHRPVYARTLCASFQAERLVGHRRPTQFHIPTDNTSWYGPCARDRKNGSSHVTIAQLLSMSPLRLPQLHKRDLVQIQNLCHSDPYLMSKEFFRLLPSSCTMTDGRFLFTMNCCTLLTRERRCSIAEIVKHENVCVPHRAMVAKIRSYKKVSF